MAPKDWRERFLRALGETHMVAEACKAARVSRTFVYGQRRQDPEFAERWEDVVERSTEVLEQIAVRRAAEGSDTLMIFMLKARRPEVYRENVHHDHEHQHQVNGSLTLMVDGKQPIQLDSAKRREAARALQAAAADDVIEGTAEDLDDAAVG